MPGKFGATLGPRSSIAANSTCGVYRHPVSRPARELACIEPLRVPRKAKVSQRYAATADGWQKGPSGDSFYPGDRGRSREATSGRDRRSVCTILPTPLERIYPPSRREPVRRLSFPSTAICTSYLSQDICRKSFIAAAQLETGNGITLCSKCHTEMHEGFNGRPDLAQPVDTQGGEKLQKMERLYSILTDDAVERGLTREEFYFLSDKTLATFKRMQGYPTDTYFPGARVEQAYLILAECELGIRQSTVELDGMPMPDKPLLPGGLFLVFPETDGKPRRSLLIQTYVPRWKP
jgi:hypothetical protein